LSDIYNGTSASGKMQESGDESINSRVTRRIAHLIVVKMHHSLAAECSILGNNPSIVEIGRTS
jgi:hypothetical protein